MPYTPILATLGYVLSADRRSVLMIHRNARAGDPHLGKYNGLGGKIEADEDIVAGMRREIREEAGIECAALDLRGTISWPGFGKGGGLVRLHLRHRWLDRFAAQHTDRLCTCAGRTRPVWPAFCKRAQPRYSPESSCR